MIHEDAIQDLTEAELSNAMALCQLEMKKLKALHDEMNREFLRRTGSEVGVEVKHGRVLVKTSPNRRFDIALAETLLSEDQKAAFTTPQLDKALIKESLSPGDYAVLCRVYAPKVTVTITDD